MSVQENIAELESPKPAGHRWGLIAAIYIGDEAREPMTAVAEVHAIAGAGLEGDRYCGETGTFSQKSPGNQVTLIESEALAAAARDYKFEISDGDSRRNLLTTGMALN